MPLAATWCVCPLTLLCVSSQGGDPLKPNYGGDPAHVQGEMLRVNARLDLPAHGGHLALHWCEWPPMRRPLPFCRAPAAFRLQDSALTLAARSARYEWDTLGYALGSNNTECDRPKAP